MVQVAYELFPDGRSPTDPFFLAQDRTRAYTYSCAEKDHRRKILDAGLDPSKVGTLHGARVGGNDATTRNHPLGAEMSKAHGGWVSWQGKTRYDRFGLRRDVAPIAAYIVGAPNPYCSRSARPPGSNFVSFTSRLSLEDLEEEDEDVPAPAPAAVTPRAVRTGKRTVRLAPAAPSTSAGSSGEPSSFAPDITSPGGSQSLYQAVPSTDTPSAREFPAHLPPGWTTAELSCRKGALGMRKYKMHRCDFVDGSYLKAPSVPEAWRIHEDFAQSMGSSTPLASGGLVSAVGGPAETSSSVAEQGSPPAAATPTPSVSALRSSRAASRSAQKSSKSAKKSARSRRKLLAAGRELAALTLS